MRLAFLMGGLALVAAGGVAAEELVLVEEGKPLMSIVVEADADDLVQAAAGDLRHYVKAMTGVELPLVEGGKAIRGKGFFIGACEPRVEEDLPPVESNPETYAVKVREGNVFLSGRHGPATAFAVTSFIEDDLGVRWFAPGDLWEYVPPCTPGELVVDVASRVVTPDWSCRVWSGHGWTGAWRAWCRRNKAVSSPPVPFRNMQNYMHKIFAPEKYAESHPEYYPLIGGKRWIPKEDERAWRPCESNPDVVRITVEAAREYLDAHPEHNSFSVAMDDIYRLCACEQCCAMDASPDDYREHKFSDRHYTFVNAVARELAKTHKDKYIGTLCYHIARELPETVEKLEPNVFISMTQCVAEWWRPGLKEEDMALTRAWRERCAHMSRYDYMGLGFLTPRVFPHAMAEAMKFDHELGFEAVYNECYTFLPNTAPMMWMVAKLQWDTGLDADGLLNTFYDRMFGSAAGTMRAYYDTLERSWMTPRPGRNGWGHRNLRTQSGAMSVADIEEAEGLLARAAGEATDEAVLKRIEVVGAGLRYGAYIVRARELAEKVEGGRPESVEEALEVVSGLEALARLSKEREAFWAEAMKRDDLVGETLRGLSSRKYFEAGQISRVEAPGHTALVHALDVIRKESREQAAGVVARFAEQGDAGLVELAEAWLAASDDGLKNELKNGDFEEAGKNRNKAEADWKADNAPPGWSSWTNGVGGVVFTAPESEGRGSSQAAGIEGASSACYLQSIKVKPGQRVLCKVWAKPSPEDAEATGLLGARWRTSKDEWHERRDLEPSVAMGAGEEGWQLLTVMAHVPEGARKLVFMLSAKSQKEDAGVLFDDAGAYVLPE